MSSSSTHPSYVRASVIKGAAWSAFVLCVLGACTKQPSRDSPSDGLRKSDKPTASVEAGAEAPDSGAEAPDSDSAAPAGTGAGRPDGQSALLAEGSYGSVFDAQSGEPLANVALVFEELDQQDRSAPRLRTLTESFAETATETPGLYAIAAGLPEGFIRITLTVEGYSPLVAYRYNWYSADCDISKCHFADFELWPLGVRHIELPDMLPDPRDLQQPRLLLTNQCDERDDIAQCLRVDVGAANMGHGDLFLTAAPDDLSAVTQHLWDSEGGIADSAVDGRFEHHDAHNHIHFGGWAFLRLRAITEACQTQATATACPVSRIGEKISFCLRNTVRVDTAFTGELFYDCILDEDGLVRQGISAGWMDIYSQDYRGQIIDVTELESGDYWIETVVNPDQVIQESNYQNNIARQRIQLELPECGDGEVSFPESCEGSNLNGESCESVGESFTGGSLSCTETCGFDRSACELAICSPTEIGEALGIVAEGSNASSFDSHEPANCQTPNGTGKDVAFSWRAPQSGRYHIVDRAGAMLISVRNGRCSGEELACIVEGTRAGVDIDVNEGQDIVIVLDVLPGVVSDFSLEIAAL